MRLFLMAMLPVAAMAVTTTPKIIVSSKTEATKEQFVDQTLVLENLETDSTGLLIQKLATVPGIFVNQTGGPAAQATIHIRGSEFRHVLVLIDGVRVNDPSTTSKEANINALNLADIEKVEVIKGTQSLLYGSDAIGGIINIITKDSVERNSLSVFSGFSNGAILSHGIKLKDTSIVLNYQYEESDGISSFRKGDEKDAYINRNIQTKIIHNWSDSLTSEIFYKGNDQFTEFDNSVNDEEGVYSKNQQHIISHKLTKRIDDNKLSLRTSLNRTDRPNDFRTSETLYEGLEQTNEITYLVKKDSRTHLLGVENINEEFTQSGVDRESAYLNSIYYMYDWKKGSYFGQVGTRLNSHKSFGEYLTPGLGVGKTITDKSTVSINVQNGFKSPSLYQLYGEDATFGKVENTDLTPEKSTSVDLTFDYGAFHSISLFYTFVDDVIINSSSTPDNGDYLEISGVEMHTGFSNSFSKTTFGIELIHYFQPNNDKIYKRPNERATLNHLFFVGDAGELNLDFQYVGARFDQNFNVSPTEDVRLKSYELLNISYKHNFKDYEIIGGVDNLFNERYESAFNYNTLGQTAYAKVKYFY